jgi:hypothetical protein
MRRYLISGRYSRPSNRHVTVVLFWTYLCYSLSKNPSYLA